MECAMEFFEAEDVSSACVNVAPVGRGEEIWGGDVAFEPEFEGVEAEDGFVRGGA